MYSQSFQNPNGKDRNDGLDYQCEWHSCKEIILITALHKSFDANVNDGGQVHDGLKEQLTCSITIRWGQVSTTYGKVIN